MEELPKQPTTMEKLPEEVLSDILIRLPAKRLAQFRCVSKPMNALLSRPSFIKSHLHRSILNNDEMLMVFYDRFCFKGSKPITGHPSRSPRIENPNFIKLPANFNIPPRYTHSSVIGSIKGLICFLVRTDYISMKDSIIYIWNPSLSALRTLLPFTIRSAPGIEWVDLHIRFGFDPKTDDFKVVKFSRLFGRPGQPLSVFDVKKVSIVGNDGHDGHLHWLCYVGGKEIGQAIVAFDLGTEIFSEISLPVSVAEVKKERKNVLGDLSGKVCVMSYIKDGDIEVWVMNEYGLTESWVKCYVFSQFSGDIVPTGFTLNNEFLLQVDNNHLALYDQIAAKVKSFKVITTFRHLFDRVRIVPFVDSLVWIAPAN